MDNIFIFSGLFLVVLCLLLAFIMLLKQNKKIQQMTMVLKQQTETLISMRNVVKNKIAVNETSDKAEIIYQDLLQHLIPIMAILEIMPRQTSEHPLWRALGGIMDEYSQNPFVLEKLRRSIKLNPDIARHINLYLNRANMFLQHMATTDKDGILSTTFTDGLLGQSLTFFAQAQALANTEK